MDSNASKVNNKTYSSGSIMDNLAKGKGDFIRARGKRLNSQNLVNFELKTGNRLKCLEVIDEEDLETRLDHSEVFIDNNTSFGRSVADTLLDCSKNSYNPDTLDKINVLDNVFEILLIDVSFDNLEEVTKYHHGEVFDGLLLSTSSIKIDVILENDSSMNLDCGLVPVSADVHTDTSVHGEQYIQEATHTGDLLYMSDGERNGNSNICPEKQS